MKQLLTILPILFSLLLPTLPVQGSMQEHALQASEHVMEVYDDCESSLKICCPNTSVSSFYDEEVSDFTSFITFHRVAYSHISQHTLLGSLSLLYRPPIV